MIEKNENIIKNQKGGWHEQNWRKKEDAKEDAE